jgi:energy-coupling factor transporter ATP-binding protein EcfA2
MGQLEETEYAQMKLNVPAGARWYKFDFHCHTPASSDYGAGPNQDTLKPRTPEEWLLDYMGKEIDCVAVTDHNTGAWIDRLKATYEQMRTAATPGFRELVIFPGVEISCQSNVHVLAIFGPDATSETISDLLASVGYSGTKGQSDGVTEDSVEQVCAEISRRHGLAILAHVDEGSGAFKELRGTTLESLLKCDALAAIEISDPRYLRERRAALLATPVLDPDAERLHQNFRAYEQTASGATLAEVVGSDAHHPDGPPGRRFPGCRFTWVKMGADPCLEGLRLALHDGKPLSIRRSDEEDVPFNPSAPVMRASTPPIDPNVWAENTIESLSISEGYLVGRTSNRDGSRPLSVSLSPWLNCIVGGRGSGKSTLVEMARLVLRREKELAGTGEPERNFQAFAQVYDKKRAAKGEPPGALTADTEIKLIYRVGPNRYRLLWRQDAQGSSIEEEKTPGVWAPAQGTITTRFPVRIYSQKQVYSLARDSAGLLRIIDDSPEVNYAEWNARWSQELAKFQELRASARRIEAGFAEQTRIAGLLENVKKKLAVFEEAGHADVLKRYQRCRRQKIRMNEIIEQVGPLPESVLKVIDDIELPTLDEETFADAPGLDELQAANVKLIAAVDKARSELLRISEELKAALGSFGEAVWKSTWAKAVEDTEKKFEELKRQLAAVGTNDPNEYGRLVQQRQGYEAELKKIEGQKQQLQTVEDAAKTSYGRLAELRRELTKKRTAFLAMALKDNRFVRMSVIPYGNFSNVEDTFRALIGKEGITFAKDILQEDGAERSGLLADLYGDYAEADSPNTPEFEKKLLTLKQDIAKARREGAWEGRGKPFVSHLASMQPEQLDRLVAWWPEDSLKIEYSNGSAEGRWRSISEGSPGQKTAAMLAFLLSYGKEPMILDQPEDDLDNHLIYDLIVNQIRQNKTKRQIIVVTHNPNIVVNGDAEYVAAMGFKAGQCRVSVSGCLQEKAVRDEICRVMEGGREAFQQRYRRVILENK